MEITYFCWEPHSQRNISVFAKIAIEFPKFTDHSFCYEILKWIVCSCTYPCGSERHTPERRHSTGETDYLHSRRLKRHGAEIVTLRYWPNLTVTPHQMSQHQNAAHFHQHRQHFAEQGQQPQHTNFDTNLERTTRREAFSVPMMSSQLDKGMQSTTSTAVPIAWFIDDLPYRQYKNTKSEQNISA